jgi:hypothetical protein
MTGDSMGVWLNTYLSKNMSAQFTRLGKAGRFDLYRVEIPGASRTR